MVPFIGRNMLKKWDLVERKEEHKSRSDAFEQRSVLDAGLSLNAVPLETQCCNSSGDRSGFGFPSSIVLANVSFHLKHVSSIYASFAKLQLCRWAVFSTNGYKCWIPTDREGCHVTPEEITPFELHMLMLSSKCV